MIIQDAEEVWRDVAGPNNSLGLDENAPWTPQKHEIRALMKRASASSLSQVSVELFGAVGDGVTDDRAAIQSAIDATPDGGVIRFTPGKRYRIGLLPETGNDVVSAVLDWVPDMPDFVGVKLIQRNGLVFDYRGAEILCSRGYPVFEFGCRNISYLGQSVTFDIDPTAASYNSVTGFEPSFPCSICSIGGVVQGVHVKHARRGFLTLRARKRFVGCVAEKTGYKAFGHYATADKANGVTGGVAAVAAFIGCDERELHGPVTRESCIALNYRADGFYNAGDVVNTDCSVVDPIDPATVGETLCKGFNNAGGISHNTRCGALWQNPPASVLSDGQGPSGSDVFTQGFGAFDENSPAGAIRVVNTDCWSDGFAQGFVGAETERYEFLGDCRVKNWTINALQAVSKVGQGGLQHVNIASFTVGAAHPQTSRGAPDSGLGVPGGIVITKHSTGGTIQFVRLGSIRFEPDTASIANATARNAIQSNMLRVDQESGEQLFIGEIDITDGEAALSSFHLRNATSIGLGLNSRSVINSSSSRQLYYTNLGSTLDLAALAEWFDLEIIVQSLSGSGCTISLGHPLPVGRRITLINLSSARVTLNGYQIDAEGVSGEASLYAHCVNSGTGQRTAITLAAAHSYSATSRSNMVPVHSFENGGTISINNSPTG